MSSGGILNKEQANLSQSRTTTIGASDKSIAFSTEGPVSLVDPGAFEFATRFAQETLGLVENVASNSQKSFERALAQTLNTADAERTGGSQRLMYLAAAAFAAFLGYAYLVKH